MEESNAADHPQRPARFRKSKSQSHNMHREAVWRRRRRARKMEESGSLSKSKSFTLHDLDDIQASFELGFGLDSPDLDPKLYDTFPALEFYRTVTGSGSSSSRSSSSVSVTAGGSAVDSGVVEENSFRKFFNVGDPESMKLRLKQWAKAVACYIRYSPKQKNAGRN